MDDRACGPLKIPSICLMENAGAGAAAIARGMLQGTPGRVRCVCGPGGNGGDALVVARHLAVDGIGVDILRFGSAPTGDAGVQLAICRAMGLEIVEVRGSDVAAQSLRRRRPASLVIDGLFGTGLVRAIDGVAAAIVDSMNASGVPILALDLPSGLDCDSGEPLGPCVQATLTATFVAPKLGFLNPASRAWTGDVRVVGIGAPAQWPFDPRDRGTPSP